MLNLRLLLFITARSDDEAREEKKSLDQVRRVLRMQSKSFGVLRFALLRLDSVYWKGFGEVFRLSPQVERACQDG